MKTYPPIAQLINSLLLSGMNQLEEELPKLWKENPSLLTYIQANIVDGIWLWYTHQPTQKWMSPSFLALLGYASTTQWSLSFEQAVIPSENRKDWDQFLLICEEHKNKVRQQVIRLIHKEGHSKWMQCRSVCLTNNNQRLILISFTDVTLLKEKEKLLVDTNRNAKIGVWEIYLETNELYWSSITRAIHEVPKEYQPKLEEGINFYKEGHSRDTITQCVQEAIEQGKPWDVELQIVTYTGKEVWVRAIGNVEFHNGKAWRVYGSFQDIDEEKKTQEKLRQLTILEAKNEEMEQFAYIVSHDLREPLTSMMGYMQLLQEDFAKHLPIDAKELLEATVETAARMDVLIHDLLGYSREGTAKNKQLIDTNKIVQKVLSDLSATILASNAAFEIDDLPTLLVYPTELKSVFQNLISNALKFRNPTIAPLIKIGSKKLAQGWEFSIADNGIGIPQGEEQTIFNIFQRLHGEAYSGTGIGLASCRKIVEHHNGRIWVESKIGVGSCFYFTILE